MIANGEKFEDIRVCVDGGTFVGCTFERCTLTFSGILPWHLQRNSFIQCKWEFAGPAANALSFMKGMYAVGANDIVERMFDSIRTPAARRRQAGDTNALN